MISKPTANRNNILLQAGILIIVLVVLVFGINYLGVLQGRSRKGHTVTYRVEGSATSAVVTFTQKSGDSTQPETVGVPWQKRISFSEATTVILTATNPSQVGYIKCRILLDGRAWKEQIAEMPKDKIACAGIVP